MCAVNQDALDAIQQVLYEQEQTERTSIRFLRIVRSTLVDAMCQYYENDMTLGDQEIVSRRSSWLNPLKRASGDDDFGVTKVIAKMVMTVHAFRTRLEGAAEDINESSLERCVEVAVRHLFKHFSVRATGRVNHEDLTLAMAKEPFALEMTVKQSLSLLRSFGLHSGFDHSEFVNIVALSFQELMSNVEMVKLDSCFGAKKELKCNICDKPVELKALESHAQDCAPDAHELDTSVTHEWDDLNQSGNLSNSGKITPKKKRSSTQIMPGTRGGEARRRSISDHASLVRRGSTAKVQHVDINRLAKDNSEPSLSPDSIVVQGSIMTMPAVTTTSSTSSDVGLNGSDAVENPESTVEISECNVEISECDTLMESSRPLSNSSDNADELNSDGEDADTDDDEQGNNLDVNTSDERPPRNDTEEGAQGNQDDDDEDEDDM
jgi:ribosomal protein S8E